jgi:excisionase family DNA binding protein
MAKAGPTSISATKAAQILGLTVEEVRELINRKHLREAKVSGRKYMTWDEQVRELARLGAAEIRRSKLQGM